MRSLALRSVPALQQGVTGLLLLLLVCGSLGCSQSPESEEQTENLEHGQAAAQWEGMQRGMMSPLMAGWRWSATGSMATGREMHTATRLPSGKVLVAGGWGQVEGSLASAEMYDPDTGSWSTTGVMGMARRRHTATLLSSGKVLVAGGEGGGSSTTNNPYATAELYDPTTGTWSPTGSMVTAREEYTATLLLSGKVLVAGGWGAGYLDSAELYDPVAGTWSSTGNMATARGYHTATLLPSGKVLVTGGYDFFSSGHFASAELYDPAAGTWSSAGSMATARAHHTATLLSSGKVLVAGGFGPSNQIYASAELYNPATNTWSPTGTMASGHGDHTATLLPSGQVLVAGFNNPSELYDPSTGVWSSAGSLVANRRGHIAALLPSGWVLLAGGWGSGLFMNSAELYREIPPPNAPLVVSPANGSTTSDNTPTYSGTAEVGSTVTLIVDGVSVGTTTAGATESWSLMPAAPLADGTHTVKATATNPGGTSPESSTNTFTVDMTAPVVVVAMPAEGSRTNNPLPTYSGTVEAGATVVITVDGVVLGSAMVTGTTWSFTPTVPLADGPHTVTATAADAAGNTAGDSNTFTVDTTPPAAPVVSTPANGSTTSDATPTYRGTAEPDSTVTVIVDGAAMGSTTAGTTGNWSLTPPMPLADGPHTVKAFAADLGGTSPDSSTCTFTVIRNPRTGGWNTTGDLVTARTGHTATVLRSGEVLVTGGQGPSGLLDRVEVYDPDTGGWSTTGALATARKGHMATLLPSGKVLVIGGEGSSGPLGSAELYDPDTGAWSTAGALVTARKGHTATVLPSGEVLVTGGEGSNGLLGSAELYDPDTGTWRATNALATARQNHTATVFPSGEVLVTGGEGSSGPLDSAELYDPDTGTWGTANPLATARQNHTATVLLSGQVLVTGGEGSSGLLASTELYDPDTGTWSTTGALATARRNPSAVVLPSGRVLVAGGEGPGGALASTEVYAPSTGVWSPTGLLTTARQDHTATVLQSGHVLITGGWGAGDLLLGSVEMYRAVGASRSAAPLPEARTDFMTVLLPNGLVMVMGGSDSSGALASARLYNPLTGLWTEAANMGTPRTAATATLLPTGEVLVTGGRAVSRRGLQAQSADEGAVLATAELFDPKTNTWRSAGSLREARYSHSALLLSTGQLLVTGGVGANDTLCSTAEVYDVATGSWLQADSMHVPRWQHMVAQLPMGQVLVAGGRNAGGDPLASAEVYDPRERKWTETAPMSTARVASTAVPLPTSQVMVVGGTDDHGSLSSAEVYEPGRGEWIPAKPLNRPRKSHTALLLPTGRVLIMGGANEGGALDRVEVYDTAQNKWEDMEPLTGPREDSVAVMLATGQVLLLGGEDLIGPLESTELYDEFGPPDPLRPVVDPLSPQRPGAHLTVRGSGFKAPPGGSSRVRLQLAPKGALRDLPEAERSDTSVQISLAGMPDGFHLLFVMVNDIAGGRVVQVDGTPPPTPEVKAFTQTPPTLSGTAEPYNTVQVFVDDREHGMVEADVTGAWRLQLTVALADGTHSASAAATDFVGNPSPRSMSYNFTVDTQAPEAPVVDPLGAIIKSPKPTLSGRAELHSTVTVFVDDQEIGTAVADTEGFWSFAVRRALGDGGHTASATARDPAGNTGPASAAMTFTVDTQAPAAPEVLTPEEGARMDSPTVTTSGRAEPGSLVRVSLDGQERGTVNADTEGTWSLTFDTGPENVERTLSATAEDAAGNISPPSAGRTFTVSHITAVLGGGCSGCAASPGESSLVLLGLAVLRRLLTRRRSTRA